MRPLPFLHPDAADASTEDAHRTEDTWRLEDLYDDLPAWEAAFAAAEASLPTLSDHRGRLAEGPEVVAEAMAAYFAVVRTVRQVFSYASNSSNNDHRNAEGRARSQRASMLFTKLRSAGAWLEPELLALPDGQLRAWSAESPALVPYAFHIDNVLRKAPHTLGAEAEAVLAAAGDITSTAGTIYDVFKSAELPFPSITLSTGDECRVDYAGYMRHRGGPIREDRSSVMEAFFDAWKPFQGTLGTALNAQLQSDWFRARTRHHDTCLASALNNDNIPSEVYRTLVKGTNEQLPVLHRYLKLRARMLGVEGDLRYHDLYAPLVALDRTYPIDDAKALAIESTAPLGDAYVGKLRAALNSRWMDVYPRTGKQTGAYMSDAAYDVHPYVLMNYVDTWGSVSTLAHEWGHAMHSVLANDAQPFETARYTIFTAEVASTFNEMLLLDHALKSAKDDEERLYFLGHAVEDLRTTFFRQAMFAEFELAIHEAVEAGEALTGAVFSERYLALLRRYHGHDEGVMIVDDHCAREWAFVSHFYYDFYVYQYATSLAAAAQFADKVLSGEEGAREKYLGVLEAGGSQYAYELLREAGVDLATPAPYAALGARMSMLMDEMEALLG
jgi:oligoendopeptidase F